MREIKLRAWLKETKEMIPVYQIDFNNGIIDSESAWRMESEYILEQFTGLHDKNGVEIFEGDIFTSDYFDDTYNFEVVFSDGAFCGKHKSTGIYMLGFTNFDDNGEDLGYWCEEDYTSHIQIIGNIHDNPELLS